MTYQDSGPQVAKPNSLQDIFGQHYSVFAQIYYFEAGITFEFPLN